MTQSLPPPVLSAEALRKEYGTGRRRTEALCGVDLTLQAGEALAIMGPSGCGKSTLLGVLGLVIRPTTGRVRLGDADVPSDERGRARARNRSFGYTHQELAIIDEQSAEANVVIPLEYAIPRVRRRVRSARAQHALDRLGLGWAAQRRTAELSGGERQRVAIARAMINDPVIILADEPTAFLDRETGHQIVNILLSTRERGAAVVIATHDPEVADRCDRILRMRDGRLVDHDHSRPS